MNVIGRWLSLMMVAGLSLSNVPTGYAGATASAQRSQAAGAVDTVVFLPLVGLGVPALDDAVQSIAPVASTGVFTTPMDATPNPDASMIYFTATSAQGPGVFGVPGQGGSVISITVGSPISEPVGLDTSMDGQTLYIADASALVETALLRVNPNALHIPPLGRLFRVPAAGGAPTPIAGTECTAPRGLEVTTENGADMIYFTGVDPSDGHPALMKIPATGGVLTVVEKGSLQRLATAGLMRPEGVALHSNGMIYVSDRGTGEDGAGRVLKIDPAGHDRNDHNSIIADRIRLGSPAGLALTQDESLLLVSSLNPHRDSSQVLVINVATGQQGLVTKVVQTNSGSGGLHRAVGVGAMSWAGVSLGSGGGTIFRIEFR
jgi:sugar lactone lactonase YvrE